MIARSEAEAERLRSDLQRRSVQEQAASNRQHQVRKEVSQLEAQRVAAQAHLNKAHRQMHQLNLTSNEAIPHLPTR
jgi:chromosome segregation ATPase